VYRRYAIGSKAELHEAVGKLGRLVPEAGTKTGTADPAVSARVRHKLAEGEGFEPPRPCGPVDFKKFSKRERLSSTIGHHWQQSQALAQPFVQLL
jgi:hypothetical protein